MSSDLVKDIIKEYAMQHILTNASNICLFQCIGTTLFCNRISVEITAIRVMWAVLLTWEDGEGVWQGIHLQLSGKERKFLFQEIYEKTILDATEFFFSSSGISRRVEFCILLYRRLLRTWIIPYKSTWGFQHLTVFTKNFHCRFSTRS